MPAGMTPTGTPSVRRMTEDLAAAIDEVATETGFTGVVSVSEGDATPFAAAFSATQ